MLDKKANIKVGGKFELIPANAYTLQIADVNFKTQFNKFKGVEEERLNFRFIVLDEKPMADGSEFDTTRGQYLWKAMSQSLNEKSWLFKLACAVYGKTLSQDEQEAFNPEDLIGFQVNVLVDQKANEAGTAIYNNILSFAKTVKKLPLVEEVVRADEVVIEKTTKPATVMQDANAVLDGSVDEEDPFEKEMNASAKKHAEEFEEAELEAKLKALKKKKAGALA